ncbi:hypothetical protein J6590_048550 [Homalodisca vitripennis]|nr:hypothetical protein J6590_048550 [Homalodisca vitripennis]
MIIHAGWGKYPSAAPPSIPTTARRSLYFNLINPAQSVSFTAATRSVEPVSTELLRVHPSDQMAARHNSAHKEIADTTPPITKI